MRKTSHKPPKWRLLNFTYLGLTLMCYQPMITPWHSLFKKPSLAWSPEKIPWISKTSLLPKTPGDCGYCQESLCYFLPISYQDSGFCKCFVCTWHMLWGHSWVAPFDLLEIILKDTKENKDMKESGGSSFKILGMSPLLLALLGGRRSACQGCSSPCALDVALSISHSIWGSFYHALLSLQVATSPLWTYWHIGRDCGSHESKSFARSWEDKKLKSF